MAQAPMMFTREPATGPLAYKTNIAKLESTLRWRRERPIGDRAWKRAMALNLGNQWGQDQSDIDPTSDNPRDRITVNITSSTIQDFLPFLLRKDPEFYLDPTSEEIEAELSANLTSTLLNYYWLEQRMQKQLRRSVMDGLVIGHGIVKTGYNLDIAESVNIPRDGKLEIKDYVRADEPLMWRVNPFKFLFDPHAADRDLETARWAAEIFFSPRQDVMSNKLYQKSTLSAINKGRHSLTTVSAFLEEGHKDGVGNSSWDYKRLTNDEGAAHELVVLVEMWDKKFNKYYVFPWGVAAPLIEESWKFPYLDGFPYAKFDFIALNDEPYGLGIPTMIEDQQHELNRIRTAEYNHRRKHALRKIAVSEGALDAGELYKLTNNKDEVLVVNGLASEVLSWVQSPALPADNYRVDQTIKSDILAMTGQDQLVGGGPLPSRTTAKEVEAREKIIGLKSEERIQRVDDFVFEIGSQMLKHIQANVTTEKVVRIVGEDGKNLWRTLSPEDIKRDYDLSVVTTSKPKSDPISEQATRMQVFQITLQQLPFLMQSGYQVNVPEMLTWLLESFNMSRAKAARFISPAAPQLPPDAEGMGGPQPGPVQEQGDPDTSAIASQAQPPESAALGAALGG